MSIALPSTAKQGLSGLLGRKRRVSQPATPAKKTMGAEEIAKRFVQTKKPVVKPAKLSATERKEQDRLCSLRGALYADD